MSKRDLRLYIEDILESIEAIKSYITDINNFDDFAADRKTYSATLRESIVIHKQREKHVSHCKTGNKARLLEKMRKEKKQKLPVQEELIFGEEIGQIAPEDQPYAEEHEWQQTRYAGAFVF